MRWRDGRRSSNVEDRRGRRPAPRGAAIGGGGLLIMLLIAWLMGAKPEQLLQMVQQQQQQQRQQQQPAGVPQGGGAPAAVNPEEEKLAEFVRYVLGSTEDVWQAQFQQMGRRYREPTLVLFSDSVDSACGRASASVGPFYCPADQQVYIDLSFYDDLKRRHKAPGDFAQAYVIAHEIGHHVQNLLGISDQMRAAQRGKSKEEKNELSVRLELQADFFAGLWAHHAQMRDQILEEGDIEEGLTAASAIGDDRLQRQAQGYVVPESFTHGTSAQRVRWFTKGLKTGDIKQGDTFSARTL